MFVHAGAAGASTLELSRGACAFALGGELAGSSASLDAIYYNPSHSVDVRGFGMNVTTFPIGLDIMDNTLLLVYSKDNLGGGVRISYMDYGDLKGLDEHARGERIFKANDMIIGFLGGYRLSDKVKLGMEFIYFKEVIDAFTGNSYNVSLGISGNLNGRTEYGVSLRNVGTGLKFINEASSIPITLALGGRNKVNDNLNLFGHLRISRDVPFMISLGAEYAYDNIVSFRMGFRSDKAGILSKFSTGIGFVYKRMSLDFGLSGYQNLGIKYVVSLTFKE